MIVISKEEATEIRKKLPDVHIVRTAKSKSKRHKYYCEETRPVMRILNRMRGIYNQPSYKKHKGNNYKKG